MVSADTLEGVVVELTQSFPRDEEGLQSYAVTVDEEDGGVFVLRRTTTGISDDSVKGIRQTWRITRRDNTYYGTWAGDEYQCWRGPFGDRWRTEPCP